MICVQEHRCKYCEQELKYDTSNGWSISLTAWKTPVSTTIVALGMHLSFCAFKSLNNTEKTHPIIMSATFNGNPCTTIVSCYSPTNASDETDITTFCGELSSLDRHIPKHNELIIDGDMNVRINKDENNKFGLINLPNRNGEYRTDFSIENSFFQI